jgi:membrane protease YdiL (CAAX protease family)
MLSAKPWQPDAVMRLLIGVFTCMFFTMLAGGLLLPKAALDTGEGRFALVMLSAAGVNGGAFILISHFLRTHQIGWKEALGVGGSGLSASLGLAALAVVVFLPVGMGVSGMIGALLTKLSTVVEQAKPELQVSVQALQATVTLRERLGFAFVVIVLAPVMEEIIFRGILYPAIKQAGRPQAALWVTAVLFGMVHFNLLNFVSLTLFGVLLVWVYEHTNRLIACIFAHSLFNAANFTFLILLGR